MLRFWRRKAKPKTEELPQDAGPALQICRAAFRESYQPHCLFYATGLHRCLLVLNHEHIWIGDGSRHACLCGIVSPPLTPERKHNPTVGRSHTPTG